MLEKKVLLGVAKDKDGGIVIVEKESKKGVKVPDESVAQLTLIVWELCDKLDSKGICERLIGEAPVSEQQSAMLSQFVDQSLEFFQKAGWAAPQKTVAKKPVAAPKSPKKK